MGTVFDTKRTPRSIENSVRSILRAHTGIRACNRARAREHSEGRETIDGASLRRRVKRGGRREDRNEGGDGKEIVQSRIQVQSGQYS